jgi:hypothetical protein
MMLPFGKFGKLGKIFSVAEDAASITRVGYRSFAAFKRAEGAAGTGLQWHHVVEQTPANVARFGAENIHNTANVVRVEVAVHRRISGYYSSIRPFTSGLTVRQWLSGQSLEAQREFGEQILRQFNAGGL